MNNINPLQFYAGSTRNPVLAYLQQQKMELQAKLRMPLVPKEQQNINRLFVAIENAIIIVEKTNFNTLSHKS